VPVETAVMATTAMSIACENSTVMICNSVHRQVNTAFLGVVPGWVYFSCSTGD
jgi:hypothetical protein